jgi:hypothetical protein
VTNVGTDRSQLSAVAKQAKATLEVENLVQSPTAACPARSAPDRAPRSSVDGRPGSGSRLSLLAPALHPSQSGRQPSPRR